MARAFRARVLFFCRIAFAFPETRRPTPQHELEQGGTGGHIADARCLIFQTDGAFRVLAGQNRLHQFNIGRGLQSNWLIFRKNSIRFSVPPIRPLPFLSSRFPPLPLVLHLRPSLTEVARRAPAGGPDRRSAMQAFDQNAPRRARKIGTLAGFCENAAT